jgi:hypothetical protein
VCDRHGCTRYSRQARATVALLTLSRAPSSREDQCVTPIRLGGGLNVSAMTRSWSSARGRPGRGSSVNPPTPLRSYRARQPITVGRDTATRRAGLGVGHVMEPGRCHGMLAIHQSTASRARHVPDIPSTSPSRQKDSTASPVPCCLAPNGTIME